MQEKLQLFLTTASTKSLFIAEAKYEGVTHIKEVRVYFLFNDKQDTDILTREEIIILLKNKIDIWTLEISGSEVHTYTPIKPCFAKVMLYSLDGKEYIRIPPCDYPTSGDNLGYLPSVTEDHPHCPHCGKEININLD